MEFFLLFYFCFLFLVQIIIQKSKFTLSSGFLNKLLDGPFLLTVFMEFFLFLISGRLNSDTLSFLSFKTLSMNLVWTD